MQHHKDKLKIDFELPQSALARWNPDIKAKDEGKNTLNIFGSVGEDYTGQGTTPRLVAKVLRDADGDDVTVNINSPGGSFFDGVAIYNQLREYDGNVKVRVLGLAASAASVVALAGDEVEIADSAFFMIHNAWLIAIGNKQDMREVADTLDKFDASMRGLYADKTGMDEDEISKMMDDETWLSGKEAVEMGFASSLMGDDEVEEKADYGNASLKTVDRELAKAGMPRSKRRKLLKDLTGTQDATKTTQDAGMDEVANALSELLHSIKGKQND